MDLNKCQDTLKKLYLSEMQRYLNRMGYSASHVGDWTYALTTKEGSAYIDIVGNCTEDWKCSYCLSITASTAYNCHSCGAPKR
jgi:hypothetical protein